ncbi:DUF6223 family protein [Actinokineospora soli]|uniref:DUF6223 family protein n=1 Tax=Actinokineospora soli TaxID=1048753 RepID=A0ABW2TIQ3_9PSEU
MTLIAAQVSAYTMSAGRIGSIIAGIVAVAGIVIGVLALRRRTRRGSTAALTGGLIATALGIAVAATADGGLGTGNGLGGAFVAIALGLAATTLGGVGLRRAH